MRGALSLAAALSIPASIQNREEILFLTFTTILGTLVVLGIPLPWLLARLGFGPHRVTPEEVETRRALVETASAASTRWAQRARRTRRGRGCPPALRDAPRPADNGRDGSDLGVDHYNEIRRDVLEAERVELRRREREGLIDYSVARRIELQLDHEESGLPTDTEAVYYSPAAKPPTTAP